MLFQHAEQDRRQYDSAVCRLGFWLGNSQLSIYAADLLGDVQLSGIGRLCQQRRLVP